MLLNLGSLDLGSLGSFMGEARGQERWRIIPYPRITVETVDYYTKAPRTSFCLGRNQIDIRLSNNSYESYYVHLINRDTREVTRTLYRGWLGPGTHYLSDLTGSTFDIQGPPGVESIRLDLDRDSGLEDGRWVRFTTRYCDRPEDPGHLWITASISPRVIPQGGSGLITIRTNASSRSSVRYYLEIYNSWGNLWRRVEAWKRAPGTYDLELVVGRETPPGALTYTVELWSETPGYRHRRLEARSSFTFRVASDYYLSERFWNY